MGIQLKTHKMLWGRAAYRCAFPDCRLELAVDESETDDAALIGEECHIIAKKADGPRGLDVLPLGERDTYANLILLCCNHHTLVDKQRETYTADYLRHLKKEHERWVRETLQGFDLPKQKDDERYAGYVDEWGERASIDHWIDWCFWLFIDPPRILKKQYEKAFRETNHWIISRVWPKRYPELEAAFENYRRVLVDFDGVFILHAFSEEWNGDKYLETTRFHKSDRWSYERSLELDKEYYEHIDLLYDCMLELTRAANYICDKVRESIDASFRIKEGVLLVAESYRYPIRTEYRGDERTLYPYPGIKKFMEVRNTRDVFYGR